MFNVRPAAPSPWLHVEPPPPNEPPGFRLAADGSIREAPGAAADVSGQAIRRAPDGPYPEAYLTSSAPDFLPLARNAVQEALDQIARIYRSFGVTPSTLPDPQSLGAGPAVPAGGRLFSSYASWPVFPKAGEPATPVEPLRHVEEDNPPLVQAPVGSSLSDLARLEPQVSPTGREGKPATPVNAPRWQQANSPEQLNSEPLLARPQPSPSWTLGEVNPPFVSGGGMDKGPAPASDGQIAQAPIPGSQPRTKNSPVDPRSQGPEKLPVSEQQRQVLATKQFSRLITWEDMIREPLPEKIAPTMQQPLPQDWEAALAKNNPDYLKWTKSAAEKYGIPAELLARLFYKESTYDKNRVSQAGAKGIAQLMPIAVKALGQNPSTFDYFNAEKSINAGAALLAQYHGEFKDWRKAVAAYNMGNTAVRRWFAGEHVGGPDRETKVTLQHVFRGDPHLFDKGR